MEIGGKLVHFGVHPGIGNFPEYQRVKLKISNLRESTFDLTESLKWASCDLKWSILSPNLGPQNDPKLEHFLDGNRWQFQALAGKTKRCAHPCSFKF